MKRPSPAESPEFLPPAPPPKNQKKKTRELPNLSDCHCCNRRMNCTNPKNRLQILTSEWRIVLLCKCCYNLVESKQYCSYCLFRVSSSPIESLYECRSCRRRIHKSCASMFSFDYSGNDDFSVCFDCWVPKLLENECKTRVLRSRIKSKVPKNVVDLSNSLGNSVVCDDSMRRGEDKLNDAHFVAQKKIDGAREAKEKALNKAFVAKKAMAVASKVVGLVAVDNDGNQQGSVVDEDAQLAIRLHRAMNSSPRISSNLCLLNTQCVDVPEVNGCSDNLGSQVAIKPGCCNKPENFGGDERNGLSENKQDCEKKCAQKLDVKRSGDLDGGLITYSRKGQASVKAKDNSESDCSQRTHSGGFSSRDLRMKEERDCHLRTYRRRLSNVKRYKLGFAHCPKTYSRRHSAISESKLIYGSFKMENGTLAPAIALNCCEESRTLTT